MTSASAEDVAASFSALARSVSENLRQQQKGTLERHVTKGFLPKAELDPCLQAAPFEWPEEVGPSSEVILEVADWADASILIPHEAIRWYHDQMRRVFASFDPTQDGNEWMTDAFFEWMDNYFIPFVHHHHDAEEKIYSPAIQKAAESKGLPWEGFFVNTQHVDLMKILEGMPLFRQKIKEGTMSDRVSSVEAFKRYMEDYMEKMNEHLKGEEEFYPKTLRACMTEEEERKVVEEILGSLALQDHKVMLPTIMYAMCKWGGVEAINKFTSALPPPVKFLVKNWFDFDFYNNQYLVLHGLMDQKQPVPHSACQCSACTVC
mmetsp:Transcript_106699/g.299802  ORF Transcript_106699/g.299802 Transcript_106699/m.299802 type:complete len:319 (-) Transcript_106699:250-1206(-)